MKIVSVSEASTGEADIGSDSESRNCGKLSTGSQVNVVSGVAVSTDALESASSRSHPLPYAALIILL